MSTSTRAPNRPKRGPVTEQDRQQAVRLLGLVGQEATAPLVRQLATELAFYRETLIQCAVVRMLHELGAESVAPRSGGRS